jgi:Zn-dependent metalloprotease
MTHSVTRFVAFFALAWTSVAAPAATLDAQAELAVQGLQTRNPGALVSANPATGKARFVRVAPASQFAISPKSTQASKEMAASLQRSAASFLDMHGAAFGLRSGSADLALKRAESDDLGQTHLTYAQQYAGLPVFGSQLKVHFDVGGRITVVNGTVVPDIDVSATPSRSQAEAEAQAVGFVRSKGAAAKKSRLLIYREGLVKGVPGANRLAYEVEVWRGNQRDFLYVDAHTNKVIDRISGTPDALHRRAFDAMGEPAPGPTYPDSPFWEEGDTFPTGNLEADNMIQASKETYDLFWNAFRRDSYDGDGAIMDSVFNRIDDCPNASWNGVFISFCPGLTTDDVTGHEWAHAYTEYTDGLIYAWQSGALNEAASDIFGEVVDRLNASDAVPGNGPRTAGVCSVHTEIAVVTVNTPAAIAGDKVAGTAAQFGAQTFSQSGDVVLANDGVDAATDGCCAGPTFACAAGSWTNAADMVGKIAIVDRGTCGFAVKAKNAQLMGAVGVVIANNAVGAPPGMGGVDATVTIPALSITQADGADLKANLPANVTMSRGGTGTDSSTRWLMGEDSTAVGLEGALRDMWEPNCYINPNRVNDPLYHCAVTDNGGVHINSGVDNRAFSLLVDGGTHNGQAVGAIGMTKATHIWFRAKDVYQYPATTFAEHADALEESCKDLTGRNLRSLATGTPSGQKITAKDCRQVKNAMRAVEMREEPVQCGFLPMLAKNPPPVCPGGIRRTLFSDNFEKPAKSAKVWTTSHSGTTPDFTDREWSIVKNLPDGRGGKAFFGPDYTGGTCAPGGNEKAALHLEGPAIEVPPGNAPRVTFDHWVSAEFLLNVPGVSLGWDGGNLKVSVNGGAYQLVPAGNFVFNAYNSTLISTAQGSDNPLAGQPAYTGADGGVTSGSWYRSIVDLAGIAAPGDFIRLRFDFGNDGCGGWVGWYVDDLKVQQCR